MPDVPKPKPHFDLCYLVRFGSAPTRCGGLEIRLWIPAFEEFASRKVGFSFFLRSHLFRMKGKA